MTLWMLVLGTLNLSAEQAALLVGNAIYPDGETPLKEVRSEIPEMVEALRRSFEFSEIEVQYNLVRKTMNRSFETFISGAGDSPGIAGKDFCYLHFSGHGKIEGSRILLLPSDSKYRTGSGDSMNQTVPLNTIFSFLAEYEDVPTVVVLDCCFEGDKDAFKLSVLAQSCPKHVCLVGPVEIGNEAPAKSALNQQLLRCLKDENLKTWGAVIENLANPGINFSPFIINATAVTAVKKEDHITLNSSDGKSLGNFLKNLETNAPIAGRIVRNSLEQQFVFCPSGSHLTGSLPAEKGHDPSDEVSAEREIPTPFLIGMTEVTQRDWKKIYRSTLLEQADKAFRDDFLYASTNQETIREFFSAKQASDLVLKAEDELPIHWINYWEARQFCAELTRLERARGFLPEGWEYGLPTEWQWEYACRSGEFSPFDFESELPESAWYGKNSSMEYEGRGLARSTLFPSMPETAVAGPRAVGLKNPTPWGLYDCLGNVWELCEQENGAGYGVGFTPRRGGSWLADGKYCRPANRDNIETDFRFIDQGFRICLRRNKSQSPN